MYKIHYRFRSQSEKSLATLDIDGPYIICKELALRINNSGQFGQYKYASKDTLELSNSATGSVYKATDLVTAGASVVVRKIPCGYDMAYNRVALGSVNVFTVPSTPRKTGQSLSVPAKCNKIASSSSARDGTKRQSHELEETLQPSKKKVRVDTATSRHRS
jgi:hypothetical protein